MQIKEKQIRYGGMFILPIILFVAGGCEHGIYGWIHNQVLTLVYWQGAVFIMQHYQKKHPTYAQALHRILLEAIATFLYVVVVVILHKLALSWLYGWTFKWESVPSGLTFNLIITFFIGLFYESRFLFERWEESVIETQKLHRQTTQSQLEVLKNQVNPHFLFNSLNTLLTLIPEDKKIAKEFTRKLGVVYNYILQHQNQELTSLAKEFEFIRAYLFLQQIRFGENLQANIRISETYMTYQIVPLSLQMLVENAIKHNIISNARPLFINIEINEGKLLVSNNLQLKKQTRLITENSTKIGLKNIKDRYGFFTQELVIAQANQDKFEVSLPLLPVSQTAKIYNEPLITAS